MLEVEREGVEVQDILIDADSKGSPALFGTFFHHSLFFSGFLARLFDLLICRLGGCLVRGVVVTAGSGD